MTESINCFIVSGMRKRFAIYARISTDAQEGEDKESIPDQLEQSRRYGGQLEVDIVMEKSDVMSGTNINRPGLSSIRQAMRSGEIDGVICFRMDRLTREPEHWLIIAREAEDDGKEIHFVRGGKAKFDSRGKFQSSVDVVFAAWWRSMIQEDMQRGKSALAKKDPTRYVGGSIKYGYRVVDKRFELDPEEAEVVLKIKDYYLVERISTIEIADRLTRLGVQTPGERGHSGSGKWSEWRNATIVRILKDPIYTGRRLYGDMEMTNPALWDENTRQTILEVVAGNRTSSSRSTLVESVVRGNLVCKKCGNKIYLTHQNQYRYLVCSSKIPVMHRTPCGSARYPEDLVSGQVWSAIRELLLDPMRLKKGIESAMEKAKAANAEDQADLKTIKKELARLTKEAEALGVALVSAKGIVATTLEAKMNSVNESYLRLKQEEADREKTIAAVPDPVNIESARRRIVAGIDAATVEDKRRIMSMLGFQGVIGDGRVEITLGFPCDVEPVALHSPVSFHRIPLWFALPLPYPTRRIAPKMALKGPKQVYRPLCRPLQT